MDTQTRHALKGDSFAKATVTSMGWLSEHRSGVLRWILSAVVLLVVVIGGLVGWTMRAQAAAAALGAALDTYSTPLAELGAPAIPGTYATSADRARAAHQQFADVASKYGLTPEGKKAHYFVGVTAAELGQNGTAESELKIASGSWNHNISNLAKVALANLYHDTGRDGQAEEIYSQVAAKPSETVSAYTAKLDLADLYSSEGKQDQARRLWAEIKDGDKDGIAGAIAGQKLTGNK